MLPSIIGSSVAQINLLFDTIIASFLVAGSVSWLYYSDRLVNSRWAYLALPLATVILPNLSVTPCPTINRGFSPHPRLGTCAW